MIILLFLIGFIAVAALSAKFGVDSRHDGTVHHRPNL